MGHGIEEKIRLRAYEKFLSRSNGHGSDIEDWLDAEREIVAETAESVAKPQRRKRKVVAR